MKKQSDKGPVVAQGASSGQVQLEARAEVMRLLAAEVTASVPPEVFEEMVALYLSPGGSGVTELRALLTPIARELWKASADRVAQLVRTFREI